jgi:hypothetical protein
MAVPATVSVLLVVLSSSVIRFVYTSQVGSVV